jgi:SAM-dependent methyltransferase
MTATGQDHPGVGPGPGRDTGARWLSPGVRAPARYGPADDRTTAAVALARARRGEGLVYAGDYHNARQLLSAMGRRLRARPDRGPRTRDPAELFRRERDQVLLEHELLARLLAPIEAGWRVALRRSPDVREACEEAFGPAESAGLLPLRDLLGAIGAHEWRRRGVDVPALGAPVHPWFGVYAPVRGEYVDLVARATASRAPTGLRALDVGTGTGVLALLLARAGAQVVATDLEPAAVGCARENAARLGLADRVEVIQADLFPDGPASFDLVVSNPPWLPAAAHTALDRAVYDPGGAFLARLVRGLPARLAHGGEAWVVISDLAERLGLRPAGHLAALAAEAGLAVTEVLEACPTHPRARDTRDPLHAFRAAEVTRLHRLVRAP